MHVHVVLFVNAYVHVHVHVHALVHMYLCSPGIVLCYRQTAPDMRAKLIQRMVDLRNLERTLFELASSAQCRPQALALTRHTASSSRVITFVDGAVEVTKTAAGSGRKSAAGAAGKKGADNPDDDDDGEGRCILEALRREVRVFGASLVRSLAHLRLRNSRRHA